MAEKRGKDRGAAGGQITPKPTASVPSQRPVDDPWEDDTFQDPPAHGPAAVSPKTADPEPAFAYPTPMAEVELRRTQDRMAGGLVRVSGIITPVTDVKKAVEAWSLFNELKEKLLTDEDYYIIRGTGKIRRVPTRTGWRKLGLFFGVSTEIVEEKRWERSGVFGYDFMVRAIAPNGQMMVGVGSCDSFELGKAGGKLLVSEHNVRAKAHTRAVNRAISDLIGGGELSAEEIEGTEEATA